LLDAFDYTTVASHAERELATSLGGKECRIQVLPNAIDLSRYPATGTGRDADSLLFTGSFEYEPNYQGMVWFQENVYRLLAAERPALRVTVTGKHGNRPLPNDDVVTRTGWIDDIRPTLASATCCVVPLLEGGGTRLKILEAMALRTPVVSTSKGAQGLNAEHGKHLLIADSPRDFADAVKHVLASPTLAATLGDSGYRLVEERYDAGRATALLLELIERTTSRRQRAEPRPILQILH
jgi:glycosyltransferase involved in cell wall biosynthesis